MQIDMLPLRYKFFAFAITMVLLAWLFSGLVLFPAQQRIAEMENQLRLEHGRVKVLQDFGLAHLEPANYLKLLDDKLAAFNKLLPPEAQISEFLLQSEAAANASGVQLVSLKPGNMTNKNGYRDWTIEMIVRGGYFQTLNFMKRLEAGTRFNTATSVVLQSKSDTGYLESRFSFSIYSFGAAPAK